jgi:hypothetical protein
MAGEVEAETLTIRQLRRRWKPHKERLTAEQPGHPTTIRFHRACNRISTKLIAITPALALY